MGAQRVHPQARKIRCSYIAGLQAQLCGIQRALEQRCRIGQDRAFLLGEHEVVIGAAQRQALLAQCIGVIGVARRFQRACGLHAQFALVAAFDHLVDAQGGIDRFVTETAAADTEHRINVDRLHAERRIGRLAGDLRVGARHFLCTPRRPQFPVVREHQPLGLGERERSKLILLLSVRARPGLAQNESHTEHNGEIALPPPPHDVLALLSCWENNASL